MLINFLKSPKSVLGYCPTIIWRIGRLALFLYSLFLISWPEVGSPAETVMAVLGLLALLIWGGKLRKGAALWLLLAIVVVQVISWGLGYFHHPHWVADNPQIDRLAKLFIFIGVAWWLGGSTSDTLSLWAIALLGYFVALFVQGNGSIEWLEGLGGKRVDFGIRNAQHAAMFFGVGLLGLLAFSRRSLASGSWVFLRRLIWALGILSCATGVVITQTRAVWLALIVSLPIMVVFFAWYYLSNYPTKHARLMLLASFIAVGVLVVTTASLGYQNIAKRLEHERPVIEGILTGEYSKIPYNSSGTRIHTWLAATEWIAERPIVGWGGQGRSLVIDHTEWLPKKVRAKYGHLHNYFLELWVAYGLLGVAVISALAFWVARATWLAWRGGAMPSDMALFGVTFFVYWVIINQFESYNSFWTGVYVHNIVLGGLVTHYWRWQLAGARDDNTQTESTSQPK